MSQLVSSFRNSLRLFFLSRRLKSFFNFLPGRIQYNGNNVVVQESKIVGNLELGENVKINNCFFSGNITIDRFTSINGPNTSIITSGTGKVVIGSFCSIARGVQFQEFNHNFGRASSYFVFQNIFGKPRSYDIRTKGDIIIEDDVWIGANCIVLSGVTIGRGSVIAAGSVVINNVEPFSIIGGVPGKLIKKRFSDETINEIEESRWWTWELDKIIQNEPFFLKDRI